MAKLRILVIDDSAYNRQAITEMLESHAEIEVVGTAFDGEEGLKLAAKLEPDLITLDIEMPRMDGFTFLRFLMSRQPTPVIMISSHSRKEEVFQALELGALDFVAKPGHHLGPDTSALRKELIDKVLMVRSLRKLSFESGRATRAGITRASTPTLAAEPNDVAPVQRLLVVGASTGGPPALESIFKALPQASETAFLVAQHMPEKFTKAFAERLNRIATLRIIEGSDGEPVRAGSAYVAPGGGHMTVGPDGVGGLRLQLVGRVEEDRYTPSIDRLLESAAGLSDVEVMAVILTGMGADGRIGVSAVHAAGGRTLAESEETAIVYGMPKEAIESGDVDEILPLPRIVERVHQFALGRLDDADA